MKQISPHAVLPATPPHEFFASHETPRIRPLLRGIDNSLPTGLLGAPCLTLLRRIVIRRFQIALALLLVPVCAFAAGLPEFSADHTDTEPQSGDQIFNGHARFTYDGAVLEGDQIRYNLQTQVAVARGHVVLTQGTRRLLADEITYNYAKQTYSVVRLRLGEQPLYVSGDQVTGTPKEITVKNAVVTYFEPGSFAPTLTADTLVFSPGEKIRATDACIRLGENVPLIPFSHYEQNVNDPLISYMSLHLGQSGTLGEFAELGMHVPVGTGVNIGGDLGLYTARGIMVGPSGSFDIAKGDRRDVGSLKTGYISDHGDKGTDVLHRPIPKDREFVDWQSQHHFGSSNTTITTQYSFWSDSAVVRDFHPNDFYQVQQPDSFIDATTTRDNFAISLFLRGQPNNYYAVQRRLPEVRFDLLPTPVGLGFFERFNASAVALSEHQFKIPDGVYTEGPTVKSNRLDAFYSLTRPIAPSEWFNINPVAGVRLTHYADATGGKDNYTRGLGELGFDTSLRASGVYNYRNERWDIDGIRHLVTPKLSYRYIPSADKGRAYIPAIDRTVFDTTLPPLELGDQRNIDQLRATNTLRLGLDNTFQTRDKTYGSRDLLTLNIAEDYRLHREPGEKDFSEIHIGLSLMPARWMQLDVYNSFDPQTFTARELNTRFSIHNGQDWALSLSNHYLKHQINEYITDASYRINEVYRTSLRLHYDARQSRFVQCSAVLQHNIDRIWLIEYGISWYEGRQREKNSRPTPTIRVRLTGF